MLPISRRRRQAEPERDIAEIADDLYEVQEQMVELLQQAIDLVRAAGNRSIEARAEGYWMAHIKSALGGMGYSTHATTMLETVEELQALGEGPEGSEAEEVVEEDPTQNFISRRRSQF